MLPIGKGGRSEPGMTRLPDRLHRLGGPPAERKIGWQKKRLSPRPDSGFLWVTLAAETDSTSNKEGRCLGCFKSAP